MTSRGITPIQIIELFTAIANYLKGNLDSEYVKSLVRQITSTLLSIDCLLY